MNIHDLKHIESPRLLIRPVQIGDEKALNAAINRSLESLRPWMEWAKDPSIEATKVYVDKGATGWASKAASDFPMVIMQRQNHQIIGTSGFNDYSQLNIPFYEVGYWLDAEFQGQGLVTEAVTALSQFAFKALDAKHVQLRTMIDNDKSKAVAKRSGFQLLKTLKKERVDCITGEPKDGLLFICANIDDLPVLDVIWEKNP